MTMISLFGMKVGLHRGMMVILYTVQVHGIQGLTQTAPHAARNFTSLERWALLG